MTVAFGSNYIIMNGSWTTFKAVMAQKQFIHQYDDDGILYTVFGFDGPLAHMCTIWKGIVPDSVIVSGYTQEQNDLDKEDFEDNYLATANAAVTKLAATGTAGQSPAKGLGGFAPDPANNPYQPSPDEIVSLYVDGEGSLVTRGATLTDEGSFRDDFSGSSLESDLTGTVTFVNGSNIVTGVGTIFTEEINRDSYVRLSGDTEDDWVAVLRAPNDTTLYLESAYPGSSGSGTAESTRWIQKDIGGTPGTTNITSSTLQLISGTHSSCGVSIERSGDYLPMISSWRLSLSQRITNQKSYFGFCDDLDNPKMYCDIVFDGIDNTLVKFRSAWDGDEQLSSVSLPAGLTTASVVRYRIDVTADHCTLAVNGVLIAKHDFHVPDMYAEMKLYAKITNQATVTSTTMTVDTVFFSNQDQVQIASVFTAPIPVMTKEDQHHITATKTTSSTSADQQIISYSVPTGKVFYLIGYCIDCNGTQAGTIKIGKSSITSEAAAPGTVDSNIFRAMTLPGGDTTGEVDFGANPRKLGVGGDTILVTVTPAGLLSSTWRAALDFVLR